MEKKTVYWIEFWRPGSFFGENWITEVLTIPNPYKVEWPDAAYCFSFWKREDVIDGDKTYKGEPEKISKTFYHHDSKLTNYEQTKKHPQCTKILLSNMECNNWEYLVWSRWGNCPQPFEPNKDAIL